MTTMATTTTTSGTTTGMTTTTVRPPALGGLTTAPGGSLSRLVIIREPVVRYGVFTKSYPVEGDTGPSDPIQAIRENGA
jgi:hypothetical protein